MSLACLPSEKVAVVGSIDPDANTAATYNTGWIAAKDYHGFLAIVQTGILGTAATVAASIRQATDSGGTGEKALSPAKAATTLDEAGASPPAVNDKQVVINIRPEELDVANGFDYFKLQVVLANATSDFSAVVLGLDPRFGPAQDNDAATVQEIVA